MDDSTKNKNIEQLIDIPTFLSDVKTFFTVSAACGGCQTSSELCGTWCEITCLAACMTACQSACETSGVNNCGACQKAGQIPGCTSYCETQYQCTGQCSETCTVGCEVSSQTCTTGCQVSSQGCTTGCQVSSQGCTTGCQVTSQTPEKPKPGDPSGLRAPEEDITSTSIRVVYNACTNADFYQLAIKFTGDDASVVYKTTYGLEYTFTGLIPNTAYTINYRGMNSDRDGDYGTAINVTTAKDSVRPDNWSWWSTISSGSPIAITAAEWNAFCSRINEFRVYKELSTYSFTTVSRGTAISASIVNQARTAIDGISGHGTLPSAAVRGGAITAYFFNQLKNALNAIS